MPFDPKAYDVMSALLLWLAVCGGGLVLIVGISSLLMLIRRGKAGVKGVFRQLFEVADEILLFSPRRVGALARLTFREAVRRRTLLVFVVFAVLFMFGGWFMGDTGTTRIDLQIRNHVAFALRTTSWLMLPVALLLSCWGIPEDIKARSLHTVVTKPVHRGEIVLGRMLGFIGVGTVVVGIMGIVGYVWVVRQIPKQDRAKADESRPHLRQAELSGSQRQSGAHGGQRGGRVAISQLCRGGDQGARHLGLRGNRRRGSQKGRQAPAGVFVRGVSHPQGIFRSNRLLQVRIRKSGIEGACRIPPRFPINEFGETVTEISPDGGSAAGASGQPAANLFADIIAKSGGKLRVEVQCVDSGQYLGMARPDLFIRMRDRSFFSGYAKSIVGIWLMMILVTVLGVTASCFVKGPVATLATFSLIIVGAWFREFMERITSFEFTAGGPIESCIRMVRQMNLVTPLEDNFLTKAIRGIDDAVIYGLWAAQHIIPDFGHFSRLSQYAPNGFDVDWQAGMLPVICVTLGYLLPCVVIGYFSLKLRELESK